MVDVSCTEGQVWGGDNLPGSEVVARFVFSTFDQVNISIFFIPFAKVLQDVYEFLNSG